MLSAADPGSGSCDRGSHAGSDGGAGRSGGVWCSAFDECRAFVALQHRRRRGPLPVKLLFICSQNRRRSLTAEHIFDGVDGHLARSAGTEEGARIRVTPGHLGWADVIFVMEKRHQDRLRAKFRQELIGKRVVCLHIADSYSYMDDALVRQLETTVATYLHDNQPTDIRNSDQ